MRDEFVSSCENQSLPRTELFDSFIQDPDDGCIQLLRLASPLSTCQRSAFFVPPTATLFDPLTLLIHATTAARGGLARPTCAIFMCCHPHSQLAVMHIFPVNGHREANEMAIQAQPGTTSRLNQEIRHAEWLHPCNPGSIAWA